MNRILSYLPSSASARPRQLKRDPIYFGPGTGLVLSVLGLVIAARLSAHQQDLALHLLALFAVGLSCASAATGCVVGFGNHDNGSLSVRRQIFDGLIGLVDLILAFTAILTFAGLLHF